MPSRLRNISLTISFDGTRYAGFQIQKNGLAVQEVLETALRKILKEKVRLLAAGRTDAGAHALAQEVSFKTGSPIPPIGLVRVLNALLPKDIAVRSAKVVPSFFHPRYHAVRKHYRYTLRHHSTPSPFDRLYATFYPYSLDVGAMRRAAKIFLGKKDFRSFQAKDKLERTSVRRIDRLSIQEKSPYLYIDVEGNGFLYKMVRNIVGTLLEVGKGKIKPDQVRKIFFQKDRAKAGPTAPAKGLCLMSVKYSG